jgi:hypothetical protein
VERRRKGLTAKPSAYNTSDLRRRQSIGDVGHTVLGSQERVRAWRRWRIAAIPLLLIVLGIVLGMWGPLPGLGLVLAIAGTMSVGLVAIRLFNDYFS